MLFKRLTYSILTVLTAILIKNFDEDYHNPIPMLRRLHSMLPVKGTTITTSATNHNNDNNNNNKNDSKPLRVGILGASDIAKFAMIWPASKQPHKISVVSIAARDPNKAKSYALKHNIPTFHNTYDELIQDPNIDVIYIGIITELHYSYALKAIQAQKHVYVEKPAVLTKEEALTLYQYANQYNVVVFEAFHWKYHPAAKRVLEIIQSNEIGTIVQIDALTAMFDPKTLWKLKRNKDGNNDFDNNNDDDDRARVKLLDRWCYLVDEMYFYLGANNGDNDNDYDNYHIDVIDVNLQPSRLQANLTATIINNNDIVNTNNDNDSNNDNNNNNIKIHFEAYKNKLELPKWPITIHGTRGSITYYNVIFPFAFHSIHVTSSTTNINKNTNTNTNNKTTTTTRIETKYDNGEKEGTTFEFQLDEFLKIGVHRDNNNLNERERVMKEMIRNAEMYERIIRFSGQNELKSW